MDKNRSEVYGTFTYAESLTYYDLLETENTLKENLDKLFLGAGAEHLDFTPLGDMLMFQCAFEEYDSDLYRKLADKCGIFADKSFRAFSVPGKKLGHLRYFLDSAR